MPEQPPPTFPPAVEHLCQHLAADLRGVPWTPEAVTAAVHGSMRRLGGQTLAQGAGAALALLANTAQLGLEWRPDMDGAALMTAMRDLTDDQVEVVIRAAWTRANGKEPPTPLYGPPDPVTGRHPVYRIYRAPGADLSRFLAGQVTKGHATPLLEKARDAWVSWRKGSK